MRPRLSHAGDLEKRNGRARHDGLAPLHRVPVLHGGMPVWIAKFQLA
jgi:hypothetical protein